MIGLTLIFFEEGKEDIQENFTVPSLPEVADEIVVNGTTWEILQIYLDFTSNEPCAKWMAEVIPVITDDEPDDDPDPDEGLEHPVPEGDNVLIFAKRMAA